MTAATSMAFLIGAYDNLAVCMFIAIGFPYAHYFRVMKCVPLLIKRNEFLTQFASLALSIINNELLQSS